MQEELDAPRSDGTTALWAAASRGCWDVVELLCDAGADYDKARKDDTTPMMAAMTAGHVHVVEMLLRAGANPNIARLVPDVAEDDGQTPLHIACRNGYLNSIVQLLRCGAQMNYCDRLGYNSFLHACSGGDEACMVALIEWGADVTKTSWDGTTPLNAACKDNRPLIAMRLIGLPGVDPGQPDKYGQSPIWSAAHHGQHAVVAELVRAGADPSAPKNDGTTPLFAAAAAGQQETVKLLLVLRVPIDHADNKGRTALYIATENMHAPCAESLVVAGANLTLAYVAVPQTTKTGWTREAKADTAMQKQRRSTGGSSKKVGSRALT